MTVKELMDVLDNNAKVEFYEEHDISPVFFSVRCNLTYCAKDRFEKIKDRKVTQITASEENLIFVYCFRDIWRKWLMGKCKLTCPDGETECCICCEKQGSCGARCDDMDSYEYAEECEDYETD